MRVKRTNVGGAEVHKVSANGSIKPRPLMEWCDVTALVSDVEAVKICSFKSDVRTQNQQKPADWTGSDLLEGLEPFR